MTDPKQRERERTNDLIKTRENFRFRFTGRVLKISPCSVQGPEMQMVKEFHYREATSVSSVFPGACVCGLTPAFHAEACDVLLFTSCHSLCQGVG